MRCRLVIAAVALAVAPGVALVGDPAGAQAPPCAPGDLACELVRGLDGALAPVVQPPASPPASTTPGTSPSTTDAVAGLVPGPVEASGGGAAPAELAADPARVPSVPVGQALDLPPLTIPDFGSGSPAGAEPVARPVRPLRAEMADVLPARPTDLAGQRADTAWALALALGVPAALVVASVLARRRSPRRAALPAA